MPKRQLCAVRVSRDVSVRPKARKSDQKPFTRFHAYIVASPLQTAMYSLEMHRKALIRHARTAL